MIDDATLDGLSDEDLAKRPFDELVVALQTTVQRLEAATPASRRASSSTSAGCVSTRRARPGSVTPSSRSPSSGGGGWSARSPMRRPMRSQPPCLDGPNSPHARR